MYCGVTRRASANSGNVYASTAWSEISVNFRWLLQSQDWCMIQQVFTKGKYLHDQGWNSLFVTWLGWGKISFVVKTCFRAHHCCKCVFANWSFVIPWCFRISRSRYPEWKVKNVVIESILGASVIWWHLRVLVAIGFGELQWQFLHIQVEEKH